MGVAAFKDLFDIHLGHAPGGVLGVVVIDCVNHQTVEYALHFFCHFIQQLLEFVGVQKSGNIVIGMKALASVLQALANDGGNGRTLCRSSGHRGG